MSWISQTCYEGTGYLLAIGVIFIQLGSLVSIHLPVSVLRLLSITITSTEFCQAPRPPAQAHTVFRNAWNHLLAPCPSHWSYAHLCPTFQELEWLNQDLRRSQWHPLQHSCLENPMNGGAWWAAVHGVAKSQTWLSNFTFTFMHCRRKWQPTLMFLPGESQGQGLGGCHIWGCTESGTTEAT